MEVYSAEIEEKMQRFFEWLSEKDRRRYAAIEAAKLGHGGVEYIARVLACDPKTIRQGLRDLEAAEDGAELGASEKRGRTPAARSGAADPGSEPARLVARVHRG
jgi:hypothetical protein